jgi:hypothetical protein
MTSPDPAPALIKHSPLAVPGHIVSGYEPASDEAEPSDAEERRMSPPVTRQSQAMLRSGA